MEDIIQSTRIGSHILHLNLNRPQQLNALNQALLTQLAALFDSVKKDTSIKALLITGEGKGFCAGADINELAGLNAVSGLAFAKKGQAVFNQLATLGKPSLAAIHGFAFGGGCELAMAASLRIAASGSVFGQPEIKLGIIPGFGGTQRLSRLIGLGRALEICLTGRRFGVDEAHAWGLINAITAPADLVARAQSLLCELVDLGSFALQNILSVINEGYSLPLEEALMLEATHFGLCCASHEKTEGVDAFLSKRKPDFERVIHAAKK